MALGSPQAVARKQSIGANPTHALASLIHDVEVIIIIIINMAIIIGTATTSHHYCYHPCYHRCYQYHASL